MTVDAPEETPPPAGFATFPLTLNDFAQTVSNWALPAGREAACAGHAIPGSQEQMWDQMMALDTLGRGWGGACSPSRAASGAVSAGVPTCPGP